MTRGVFNVTWSCGVALLGFMMMAEIESTRIPSHNILPTLVGVESDSETESDKVSQDVTIFVTLDGEISGTRPAK